MIATETRLARRLAALLTGKEVAWTDFRLTSDQFLRTCIELELVGPIHRALCGLSARRDWPDDLRRNLACEARAAAARELLRQREIMAVLDALATAGVHPVLFKGTPIAYTVYDAPSLRTRNDTDLLIRREDVDAVRQQLTRSGYTAPTYCDGELLFCQFELRKTDDLGVDHAFDFHWKISTQAVFADVLTFDELASEAVPVPALGPHARTASGAHALLLACVHPVMHHRNIERLVWTYDIHLLVSQLSIVDLDRYTDLAIRKRVAAISLQQLALARARFGTNIPNRVTARLAEAASSDEASRDYLQPARRWHDELLSSLRATPGWRERCRLLREVVFPSGDYILRTYGVAPGIAGAALLPALYFHRGIHGLWKVLVGRK